MKFTVQWKDPDASVMSEDRTIDGYMYQVPEPHRKIMRELGMDEYVVIEFDTVDRTARVIGQK